MRMALYIFYIIIYRSLSGLNDANNNNSNNNYECIHLMLDFYMKTKLCKN